MIAFLTDWGYDSYYVGIAKAVVREINRDVEILDICHNIKPFSVRHAAHVIERAIKDLPADTVFLAVVDPGVGTSRKPVAMVLKNGMCMVGPDNGNFTLAAESFGVHEVRELENRQYHRGVSRSFHGRDIF
ncbi:MAG: SAM-dependent chlorinase/fluorinase, partial [Mesotoga sp.]|nr:SAM-dependent chlorinase/fluorinase [Mesotoga sp.]